MTVQVHNPYISAHYTVNNIQTADDHPLPITLHAISCASLISRTIDFAKKFFCALLNISPASPVLKKCAVFTSMNTNSKMLDPFEFADNSDPDKRNLKHRLVSFLAPLDRASSFSNELLTRLQEQYTELALGEVNNPFLTFTGSSPLEEVKKVAQNLDLQIGKTLEEMIPKSIFQNILAELESCIAANIQRKGEKPEDKEINMVRACDIQAIEAFYHTFKGQKLFAFLRDIPTGLFKYDALLKKEIDGKKAVDKLPVLGSLQPLPEGADAATLTKQGVKAFFSTESLQTIDADEKETGEAAIKKAKKAYENKDAFADSLSKLITGMTEMSVDQAREMTKALLSPAGMMFMQYLYNIEKLHLLDTAGSLHNVNSLKEKFKKIADPHKQAQVIAEQVHKCATSAFYAQECSEKLKQTLQSKGYHSHSSNDTTVFLRKEDWEEVQNIELDEKKLAKIPSKTEEKIPGKLALVLAKHKQSGQYVLHASGHGDSNNYQGGASLIKTANAICETLRNKTKLCIALSLGADVNTETRKNPQTGKEDKAIRNELQLLQSEFNGQGVTELKLGVPNEPTTIKERVLTVQTNKLASLVSATKDIFAGKYATFEQLKVGFDSMGKTSIPTTLPTETVPSDHLPITRKMTLEKTAEKIREESRLASQSYKERLLEALFGKAE